MRTLSLLDVNGVDFELFQRLSGSETTMQMSLCSEVGGGQRKCFDLFVVYEKCKRLLMLICSD